VKLSVSLPAEDVDFLDRYAREQQVASRSAVLHRALRLLQATELEGAYAEAWDEWERSGDAGVWEAAAGDGIVS
jgi:Arc/MetJ-type ribon-helix-helix transcriptional regulator